MTVPVPGSLTYSYDEDGITTVFAYPVRFFEPQELEVVREVGGVRTTLTYNVDYTVSGAGSPSGGSITRAAATDGGKIIITRNTAWKQIVDLTNNGRNPAESVEQQLDRLTMAGQDARAKIGTLQDKTSDLDDAVARAEAAKVDAEAAKESAEDSAAAAEAAAASASGVTPVTNRAALKALDTANKKTAMIYAEGGRNGTFIFVPDDLSALVAVDPLEGIYIAPDSDSTGTSGAWVRSYSGAVFAEWWGAAGDDTADDSDAIHQALMVGRKVGLVGGKTYRLGKHLPMPDGSCLIGVGGRASVHLPFDIDLTGARNFGGGLRSICNDADDASVHLENVEFYGDGDSQTYSTSVAFYRSDGISIIGCEFRNFGKSGVYNQGLILFACKNILLDGNDFHHCSGDGAAIAEGCIGFRVVNNTFHNNVDWGFALSNSCCDGVVANNTSHDNTSSALGADECWNVSFVGNVTRNNEHGIRIARFGETTTDHKDIIISGNLSEGDHRGITVEGASNVSVIGNLIVGAQEHAIMLASCVDNLIVGNKIEDPGSHGILLITYSSTVGGHLITGNMVNGGEYGIRETASDGTVVASIVTGNKVTGASLQQYALSVSGYTAAVTAASFLTTLPMSFAAGLKTTGAGTADGYLSVIVGGVNKKIPLFNEA